MFHFCSEGKGYLLKGCKKLVSIWNFRKLRLDSSARKRQLDGQTVGRELVVSGRGTPILLDVVEEPFNQVTLTADDCDNSQEFIND